MRVLVTGGAGYIGSITAKKLIENGHQVCVYDNLSTGFRDSVPEQALFIFGDIRDSALVNRVLRDQKIEAVVHFAAKLVVPESVEKPLEYYDNNVRGALSVLEGCLKQSVQFFVFSSTAAVYGSPQNCPVDESSPVDPLNPYGASKCMVENILRQLSKEKSLQSMILRYFNVAGATLDLSRGQRSKNATHLVKLAAEAAVGKRDHMVVTGTDYPTQDGTGVRDYIHVEDLADAHLLALDFLFKGGESMTLNCAYGKGLSVREVLETMQDVSGVSFVIKEGPRRPGDVAQLTASGERIRQVLGWQPRFADLKTICRSAFEWEQKLSSSKS